MTASGLCGESGKNLRSNCVEAKAKYWDACRYFQMQALDLKVRFLLNTLPFSVKHNNQNDI